MNMTPATRINLNTLSSDQKKELTKLTYKKKSYFQHLFNQDHFEIGCKKISLALRKEVERLLFAKNLIKDKIPLEKLHENLAPDMKAYNLDDGVNKISTYFYDNDDDFLKTYYQLIQFLRENVVKEPFWFQATPTLRIHCPNGENSHHYPRYHSDVGYGHPPEEFNIWIPLTELLTGHSFRTMSLSASKVILEKFDYDFSAFIHSAIHDKEFSNYCDTMSNPVLTGFGHLLAFDSRCVHTGNPLKSHTRISIDIRILPLSQYEDMEIIYQGSGRKKILFAPGHCYHEKDSDQFLC